MAKGMRRAVTGGGWRQTVPLVPLALFATAFGIQAAADDPAVADATLGDPGSTGSGVVVSARPIDRPATIPAPGVVDGRPENPDQADRVTPTDPLGYPTQLPPSRVTTGPQSSADPTRVSTRPPTGRPGTTRPTGDPSNPSTSRPPTSEPPTSEPTTSRPPTSKPPVTDPVAAVQTAVGRITGTAGTTVAELRSAIDYCGGRLEDNRIPVTRDRLQSCANAFLTGGVDAVDGVIRNLLSLLGLPGLPDLLGGLPLS